MALHRHIVAKYNTMRNAFVLSRPLPPRDGSLRLSVTRFIWFYACEQKFGANFRPRPSPKSISQNFLQHSHTFTIFVLWQPFGNKFDFSGFWTLNCHNTQIEQRRLSKQRQRHPRKLADHNAISTLTMFENSLIGKTETNIRHAIHSTIVCLRVTSIEYEDRCNIRNVSSTNLASIFFLLRMLACVPEFNSFINGNTPYTFCAIFRSHCHATTTKIIRI